MNRSQLHGLFLILGGALLLGIILSLSGFDAWQALAMVVVLGAIAGVAIAVGVWRITRIGDLLYVRLYRRSVDKIRTEQTAKKSSAPRNL